MTRFLADAGISPKTVEFLKQLGHDTVHVRDLGMQRAADQELIDLAQRDGRVLLTFDLDFGEILALGVRDRPSVILLRLEDETADSVNRCVAPVLADQSEALDSGALILVEDTRYRIRKLPIKG